MKSSAAPTSQIPGPIETQDEFRKALLWSVGGHVVLLLVFTVNAVFFAGDPIRLENSIRVDIVGLPDKVREIPPDVKEAMKEPLKEPPAPKEEPPAPKEDAPKVALPKKSDPPKEVVVLKPTQKAPTPKEAKKSQESALKRLEAMARLEKQSRADSAAKALSKLANRPVRGNEVSKGNALSGLTRLDHDRYLDTLEARIRQAWNPPKFLAKAGLRVRVVLLIDSSGSVTQRKIVQSSGNSVFDDSALAAVEAAEPLPAPPDSLQSILAHQGVELDLEPSTNR